MEITWNIVNLERLVDTGYVQTAHWTALAIDDDYSASSYGSCNFSGELQTSYENLTQEQVLGWVWELANKQEIESYLATQIEAQKNPVQANGLPWA